MIKLKMSVCINANKNKVWQVLTQLEDISLWVQPVTSAYCQGQLKQGIGTVRVCKLKNNISIKEKWTDWDEGHSFAMRGMKYPW